MENGFNASDLIKVGQKLRTEGDKEGAHRSFLEAGRVLYDRHKDRILAYCAWKLGDADDGKDLTQEIFQLLWEKLPELEHPETVEGWLYGVRDNKILQTRRNTTTRTRIRKERGRLIEESVHLSPGESPEGIAIGVERGRDHEDTLRRLPQALNQLDQDDESCLRMRFYLDLSFVAIASVVGVSEATIRRRVAGALKILNEELQKQRRAS